MSALLPLLMVAGLTGFTALKKGQAKQPGLPSVPGPTDAEVLASDLRLRRAMQRQRGGRSTLVSGGLADSLARLTMPTLVGV